MEIVYSEDINHYAYVVAFLSIVLGLPWDRFKAMHIFAAPVLLLILSGFMGFQHICVSAVAIAFPLAAAMMQHYQLEHLEVFLPVAFRAWGSFLTPSSCHPPLMVMGPAYYSNKDFFKLELPMLIIYSITALLIFVVIDQYETI